VIDQNIDRPYRHNPELKPEGAPEETLWPSGFICPFHFDNPATGRKVLKQKTNISKFVQR